MRKILLAAVAAFATTGAANAANVLFANFDADNGGVSQLNVQASTLTSFFPILNTGTVDLVHTGDGFGITCAGGPGGCIDLDGSSNNGGLIVSKLAYNFAAGQKVTLSFLISGNQRDLHQTDNWIGVLSFAAPTAISNVNYDAGCGATAGSNGVYASFGVDDALCATNKTTPFTLRTFSFVTQQAGSFRALFDDLTGADNVGAILDDVRLDIATVPEPAAWALMLAGFGLTGVGLRRKRALAAA